MHPDGSHPAMVSGPTAPSSCQAAFMCMCTPATAAVALLAAPFSPSPWVHQKCSGVISAQLRGAAAVSLVCVGALLGAAASQVMPLEHLALLLLLLLLLPCKACTQAVASLHCLCCRLDEDNPAAAHGCMYVVHEGLLVPSRPSTVCTAYRSSYAVCKVEGY